MATPCFSYLRTSGPSQKGNDGFPRQRAAIAAYAKAHKLKVIQEFSDEGVSGTEDGFDRPGLTEMMIALKSNGTRTFIVENATRLARDLMVQEVLLSDCRKHGIQVLDASGIDLVNIDGDPTRTLIRQILGAVAQWEKSMLVQKLAASRKRLRKTGKKVEGAKSYAEKGHPAVERIRQLRENGLSFERIATTLNEEGMPTLRGSKWAATQVQRILARL